MNHPLASVTALLPLRVDCSERRRNLDIILDHLAPMGFAALLVGETGDSCGALCEGRASHLALPAGGPFHKTRLLNRMARAADTPLIALYDVDVIIAQTQLRQAAALLLGDARDVALPYDGRYYNVSGDALRRYQSTRDPRHLRGELVWHDTLGGAVLLGLDTFWAAGGMNEACVAWGPEDRELIERCRTLGFTVGRVAGPLWHLDHPRGPESGPDHPHHARNVAEWRLALESPEPDLRARVERWPWRPS